MADKYIKSDGLDTNDGSQGSPWQSLQYALTGSRLSKGDRLVFLSDITFPSNYIQLVVGNGSGPVTIDLGGFSLATSAVTAHLLRPFTGSLVLKNGKINILHAISLGIFRAYVSCDVSFDGVELSGDGNLGGIIYENTTATETELTLKDVRFDRPGILLYAGKKTGGSLRLNLDNAILKKCTKLWAGSGVFSVKVTSGRRSVFHGCADTSTSGGLTWIPGNETVADKSAWDIDLHGNVFIQGHTPDSGSNLFYAADAKSGRGSWLDVFESKFKGNIIYNYGNDNYDANNQSASFYSRAFNGSNEIVRIDDSNVWRPPFATEPQNWSDYAVIQDWTPPAKLDAAIIGDSIAWGQGSTLAKKGCVWNLQQFYSGTVVDASQSGMPGLGLGGLRMWADRMMCKHPAKYVAVLIGVNNLKSGGLFGNLTDQELAAVAEKSMVLLSARGAMPIWIGCGAVEGGSTLRADAINGHMDSICQSHNWVFSPWLDEAKKNPDWKTLYYDNISANIHPNDEGHKLIGMVVKKALDAAMGSSPLPPSLATYNFSEWIPFDGTLPTLEFAKVAPAKLLRVQIWNAKAFGIDFNAADK